jgi:bifunctional UDP-N-acetylglucosamine pyrophosphorylase/glucosamine-1-phosphate N-acetyltransferase
MSRPHPIVLIMAAGLGTRMKSERAKVLHEVAGRPMIAWAVETARAAGASAWSRSSATSSTP